MRTRRLLVATVVAMLATAGGAAAATLPLRTSPYVRLVRIGAQLTVKLTARARIALGPLLKGAQLTSACTRLQSSPDGDVTGISTSAESGSMGKRGRFVVITVLDTHADFCSISLDHAASFTRIGASAGPPFATIAFTRRGAVFLDEDRVTAELLVMLDVAGEVARRNGGAYPDAGALSAFTHRTVIALPTAADTPPAGQVGVYSDGQRHLEVVGVAALGQRLYVDNNAGVFSTNDAEHVFRVTGGQVATLGF